MKHDLQTTDAASLDTILVSLIEELERALEQAVLPPIMQPFGELLTRCTNASALARAAQRLNARQIVTG